MITKHSADDNNVKPVQVSLRLARVISIGNGTVDVCPVGSSVVLHDIPVTSATSMQVGDVINLQTIDNRRFAFAPQNFTTEFVSTSASGSVTIQNGDVVVLGDGASLGISGVTAGNGLGGGGSSGTVSLYVGAGDGISVGSDSVSVDGTVARSTWQVVAGSGLIGGGALSSGGITLNVNVASSGGLEISEDALQIKLAATSGLNTTNGLAVGQGNGISVGQSSVAVNQGYAFSWTSLHTFNAGLSSTTGNFSDSITGTGSWQSQLILGKIGNAGSIVLKGGDNGNAAGYIGFNSATDNANLQFKLINSDGYYTWISNANTELMRLNVVSNSGRLGINKNNPSYELDVSGSVRVTGGINVGALASGAASGQIVADSSVKAASLLSPLWSTSSGSATASPAGSLTIQPGESIFLNPASKLIQMSADTFLQSSNYTSQTTGVRVSSAGEGDFRYLFADELHAKSFISDLEQALAGGQIISKSVAVLSENFTIPASNSSGTMTVLDLPSASGMQVFQTGDVIGFRKFSRSAGSLDIGWAYGTVSNYASAAPDSQGRTRQSWTFTRFIGPASGSATGNIEAGSLVLDFGTSGNGWHEINSIDGAYALNSPYSQVVTWLGNPGTRTVRTRSGNLRGIFGGSEWGFYAGDGATGTSAQYIRASTAGMELRNIGLNIYSGVDKVITAVPNGNSSYISIGSTTTAAPATVLSSAKGVWMGLDSGTAKFRVGNSNGTNLTEGILWDGTTLTVAGKVEITSASPFGSTDQIGLVPGATPYISIGGTSYPTDVLANGSGLWMGVASGVAQFRVGSVASSVLSQGIHWNGTTLVVKGQVEVSGSSNVYTTSQVDTSLSGKVSNGGAATDVNNNSTNISGGKIRTGQIDSNNWVSSSGSAGSRIDLTNGAFYFGGSSAPKLSWNGTQLDIEGSIQLSGTSYNAPSASGLYGDASRIGYYNATAGEGGWRSWFDSSGNLTMRAKPVTSGTAATGIIFTSSTGFLQGGYYTGVTGPAYGSFQTQWATSASDGSLTAGGGSVVLKNTGLELRGTTASLPTSTAASRGTLVSSSQSIVLKFMNSAGTTRVASIGQGESGNSIEILSPKLFVGNPSGSVYMNVEGEINASRIEISDGVTGYGMNDGGLSSVTFTTRDAYIGNILGGDPLDSNGEVVSISASKLLIDSTLISNLSFSWIEVGLTGTGTFTSGWVNFDTTETTYSKLRYKKFGDFVFLRGMIKRNSGTGMSINAVTLPTGLRPTKRQIFICVGQILNGSSQFYRIDILPTGVITLANIDSTSEYTYFSLSGISFSTT